jgi:hypothetical protein
MSQLPANKDVVGLIAAAYCAMAAREIDVSSRQWAWLNSSSDDSWEASVDCSSSSGYDLSGDDESD